MIKKILLSAVVVSALTLTACDVLTNAAQTVLTNVLSNEDIGNGLKSALDIGISKGADALSQKGGFFNSPYKILLPEEARQVVDKLKFIPGFNKVEDVIVQKINEGAEDAAIKAKPIFINAIKQMTFSDALNILMGDKNAATAFLKRATYDQLYNEFKPSIIQSLDKYDARKYWSDATTAYNRIPFVKKADVTKEALNGLFSMVEQKERSIRANKTERTTTLLQNVFAKQDAQQ
jgi:Protein of unknown function (DUF4197)